MKAAARKLLAKAERAIATANDPLIARRALRCVSLRASYIPSRSLSPDHLDRSPSVW